MVIQPTLVKYPTFPLHVVVALTSKDMTLDYEFVD